MDRRAWLRCGAGLGLAGWGTALLGQPSVDVDLKQHGLVLLIRHARTEPGIGDPPNFRLGDCSTQRNLDGEGRAQSRRIGERLAAQGLVPQRVRSSAWCRCIDTAQLAFGQAEPWAPLNSFFQGRGNGAAQTSQLRQALAALPAGRVEAWVTHQVNVSALTGEGVSMGEVLLLRGGSGDARVLRRLGF